MKLKTLVNIFHAIVNANWMVQHVIQIKNGIMKSFNASVKNIFCVKKIVEIQAHVFVKIGDIQKVLLMNQ